MLKRYLFIINIVFAVINITTGIMTENPNSMIVGLINMFAAYVLDKSIDMENKNENN